MQAIILVGGLGTRLRSIVSDRPKPMALIEGKPFVEYVISGLIRSGINDIIFAVGYMGDMIEAYFGSGERWNIKISYAYEEELLGTAGAIKNAGRFITGDTCYILNGDTLYDLEFYKLEDCLRKNHLDMAIVLRCVPDVSRYGKVEMKDGLLTSFNEKNQEIKAGMINGGIYLMKRELLDSIPEGQVSLENEMIPKWLREQRRIGGLVNEGYFIDIGIPEDYYKFQKDIAVWICQKEMGKRE